MPDYVFPADDLDRPATLLASLGSFWSTVYEDQATLQGYLAGIALLVRQNVQDLQELEDSISRFTVPPDHLERWYPLRLLESEMNAEISLLRYGDDAVYGNQPTTGVLYKYGVPQAGRDYAFPAPTGLVAGGALYNRLTAPTVGLTQGTDFVIDARRGSISFLQNPFDNPLIPQRRVYDGSGTVVDREIGLWLCGARFEVQAVQRHFGYVLGLLEAPEGRQLQYREFVNSHFDAVTEGTTLGATRAAVSACTGIPFVLSAGEVVEHVAEDDRGLVIATDRQVYRFPSTATPEVAVGETTRAGQALVDLVRLFEFQDGAVPENVQALSLGRGFLQDGYYSDLTFENKSVPLVVEEDVDGYTKLSFHVGGFPTDAEKFFDDLHAAGVAKGQTLAMLLDRRTNKVGQPKAGALPAEINPLQFLCQNVLRQNAALLTITGDLGDDALGLRYLRQLRKLTPPHTALMILVELEAAEDGIIMDGPGDETGPGYEEDLEPFSAAEVTGDEVDVDVVEDDPRAYLVSERCL